MESRQTQSQTWTQVLLGITIVLNLILLASVWHLDNRRRDLEYSSEVFKAVDEVVEQYGDMSEDFKKKMLNQQLDYLKERYGKD